MPDIACASGVAVSGSAHSGASAISKATQKVADVRALGLAAEARRLSMIERYHFARAVHECKVPP